MKNTLKGLFSILLLVALAIPASATLKGIPFLPEVDERFDALEDANAGGTLASAQILVGNASNVSTAVDVTGDVTISNTGVTAIGSAKVLETMVVGQGSDGLSFTRLARASFSFADGDLDVGAHGLGVSLPAKAIITRSYIRVGTQLADKGTCTLAISCEDANNIKTATDITGSSGGAFIEGESTGAASAFKASIAATCEITATVADGGSCVPSAGTGTVFVEYAVHD